MNYLAPLYRRVSAGAPILSVLALWGAFGCGKSAELGSPPTATITADPTRGVAPLAVAFRGDAQGGTSPLEYTWTFGDAEIAARRDVEHTYLRAGRYEAVLTVTDARGLQGSASVTIDVRDGPLENRAPSALATILNGECALPGRTQVELDASASVDPEGDPISYEWAFIGRPGGSLAALDDPRAVRPKFTPDVAGVYDLRVRVGDGEKSTLSDRVVVVASDASSLTVISGAGQSVGAAERFPQPISVEARNECGLAVPAASIQWTGINVRPESATTVTGTGGISSNPVRAGSRLGAASVTASLRDLASTSVVAQLEVLAGPPARLVLAPPPSTVGVSDFAPLLLSFSVRDRFGNPTSSAEVSFEIDVTGNAHLERPDGPSSIRVTTRGGTLELALYDTTAEEVGIAISRLSPPSVLAGVQEILLDESFDAIAPGQLPPPLREVGQIAEWSVGAPTVGPIAPVSGAQVLATQPGGTYRRSFGGLVDASLLVPLDLTSLRSGTRTILSVSHWYDVRQEAPGTDGGFDPPDGGSTGSACGGFAAFYTDCPGCTLLTPEGGYNSEYNCFGPLPGFAGTSAGWTDLMLDLTPWAGRSVDVYASLFRDTLSRVGAGWYFDDLRVIALSNPVSIRFTGGPIAGLALDTQVPGVTCDGGRVGVTGIDAFGNAAGAGQNVALSVNMSATFRATGTNSHTVTLDPNGAASAVIDDATIESPLVVAVAGNVTSQAVLPFVGYLTEEVCGDGIDNDCTGTAEDGCTVLYNMENGSPGWAHWADTSSFCHSDRWQLSTARSTSGNTSWWSGGTQDCSGTSSLVSPELVLSSSPLLTFNHWYAFDDCFDPSFEPDGARVELSMNGAAFVPLTPSGGYSSVIDFSCGHPFENAPAWAHSSNSVFVPAVFDLTAFAGQSVRVRFNLGHDCGNCNYPEGWYVDDVAIDGTETGSPPWDGGASAGGGFDGGPPPIDAGPPFDGGGGVPDGAGFDGGSVRDGSVVFDGGAPDV